MDYSADATLSQLDSFGDVGHSETIDSSRLSQIASHDDGTVTVGVTLDDTNDTW